MSSLYLEDPYTVQYMDKRLNLTKEEYIQKLKETTTVYVGKPRKKAIFLFIPLKNSSTIYFHNVERSNR